MARPAAARVRYEEALERLAAADLPDERRDAYRLGIEHMLATIHDAAE